MSHIDLLSTAINVNDIRADYCILDMLIPDMVSAMIGDYVITHEGTVLVLKRADVTITLGGTIVLFNIILSDGKLSVLNYNFTDLTANARVRVDGHGSFNYVVMRHDTATTAQRVVDIYNAFMRPIVAAAGVCISIK